MKKIVVCFALVFVACLKVDAALKKGDRVFYKGNNAEVLQVVDDKNVRISYHVLNEHTNHFEKATVSLSEVIETIPSIGNYSTGQTVCLKKSVRKFDLGDKVRINAIFASDKIEIKTYLPKFIDWLDQEIVISSRDFVTLEDLGDCPCPSCPS